MAAWQDGIKHANGPQDFSTRHVMVSLWDTIFWGASDSARDLSGKGYQTVLALPDYLYFDFPYTLNPRERLLKPRDGRVQGVLARAGEPAAERRSDGRP